MSENKEWNLNKHLSAFRDADGNGLAVEGSSFKSSYPFSDRITCEDGFSLSVQANSGTYCSPRNNFGPWFKVEVGFPSATPELILRYAEDEKNPTDTVYGYVPIDLVEQLIQIHGGPDEDTLNKSAAIA